jgi:hypothetical protein
MVWCRRPCTTVWNLWAYASNIKWQRCLDQVRVSSRKIIKTVSNCWCGIWNSNLGYTSRLKTDIHLDYITQQDCLWCTPWNGTHARTRRSLLSAYHTVARFTHKCYLTYANKKCGFPCTQFCESETNRHSTARALIANTEFHPNKTIHLKSTDKNHKSLPSQVWLPLHRFSWKSQVLNGIMWRIL